MVEALTEVDRLIIKLIQTDLPLDPQPYKLLATKIGISEAEFLERLQSLADKGVMRRFGATLRHQKSGYSANAMGAWQVAETDIETVGEQMAAFPHVSHCYRRNPTPQWPFNLYTMIHAKNIETCHALALEMSQKTGVATYRLLFSQHELKKTSMQYFKDAPMPAPQD
jgi:DNA-binding Lrp family transcriptional regulator